MKRLLFFFLLATVATISCVSKKNMVAQKHNVPANISYSTGFDIFMDKLKAETQGLTSWDDYIPSNTMRQEFEIVTMPDGSLGIQGFIQVIPSLFDAYTFESLEGYLVYIGEGLYQYKIPIKNLRTMLDVKGISQVDVARKAVRVSEQSTE